MQLISMTENVAVDPYPALAAFLLNRYDEELIELRRQLTQASRRNGKATTRRKIRSLLGRRRIVEAWSSWLDGYTGDDFNPYFLAQQTLRQLASEYEDHPGYRTEWRP